MSNLEVVRVTCLVEGEGKTKNEAVESCFRQLMKDVVKEVEAPIIKVNVVDAWVEKISGEIKIEKFLFFFLPREHTEYKAKIKIEAEITILKI